MIKPYCTANNGDCETCSFVNYNRDCQNKLLLTEKENEVIALVFKGLANKDIAEILKVNERTIETHVRNILRKLDCKNRVELIVLYRS